jgi:hypothetical protein
MARYLFFNPQKDYEKSLHMIYLESQVMKLRKLEQKIWDLQYKRQDVKYNLFIPYLPYRMLTFREAKNHTLDEAE